MLMYPQAAIPCVQLSLLASLDAAAHIRVGSVLAGLRRRGVMIIGSGFSFHNLRALLPPGPPEPDTQNQAFEDWLIATCSDAALDESERTARLSRWEEAPSARYCHPREEHLLPLHVCYGATKRACSAYAELTIMNKKASTFFW
jgi:aromatic ring-opening dioxygenase catalytic subunit (LigB family)